MKEEIKSRFSKDIPKFVMFFMLLIIIILSIMIVEQQNKGFEVGRYQGWAEACSSVDRVFGLNSFGEYSCEENNDEFRGEKNWHLSMI